ncbi:chemotaxis protein CheA [Anoxybacter fermentans]|nr:chemotaxis protein CheA [Anoxybacter fermentans]
MSQYLRMFLDESEEYLQSLNQNLLELENNPNDEQLINEIFRAAHSLKGMAATMGFDKMANLTHEMENVLDRIRAKKLVLKTEIVDILFICLDRLEKLVKEIATSGNEASDVEDIVLRLQNIKNEETSSKNSIIDDNFFDLESEEKDQILQYLKKGYFCYLLDVELVEGCLLKSVRGFMVIKSLKEIGIVIKSIPSLKDIEDEKFDYQFKVLYITKESEKEIRETVTDIIDVKGVTITRITEEDLEGQSVISTAEMEIAVTEEKIETEETPQIDRKTSQDIKVSPTIRVDIDKLDSLMNLVAELLINKTRLEEICNRMNFSNELLNDILQQLDRVTMNLQHTVMQVRMVPIERIFNRFPRMVRDLSKELNKKVNLIIEGAETELDRSIIDSLGDPLVHLLRNAIDHGIEDPETRRRLGKPEIAELRLTASQKGNEILIQVIDDGRGLDPDKIGRKGIERGLITKEEFDKMSDQEKINLIFRPGFSTSDTISDISGRGVGLDVVKRTVESLDGHIDIDTEIGKGTTFNISLPLTLAITQALLVKICDETYAIPLSVIVEAEDITPDRIQMVQGQEVFLLRGHMIPLVWSHKLLGLPVPDLNEVDQLSVVVIRTGKKYVGLIVTELINQQDIVIKSLGEFLINTPHISGATILGDGEVALILDVRNIA